jgi:hypothetical protein
MRTLDDFHGRDGIERRGQRSGVGGQILRAIRPGRSNVDLTSASDYFFPAAMRILGFSFKFGIAEEGRQGLGHRWNTTGAKRNRSEAQMVPRLRDKWTKSNETPIDCRHGFSPSNVEV